MRRRCSPSREPTPSASSFINISNGRPGEQLERAQQDAQALGMGVGIYLDLAISIDRGGAESWANQELYAVGASVGAPPDEVNLLGQNWGLPPLRPNALEASRYEPFIATLRANMRYSGALRIDHVMGLYRLYWIPPGATAAEGAYVHYRFEDLLTILALESVRNECMVIGEDLGTVPDEVREGLQATRVMSYRVLYFERDTAGRIQAARELSRGCAGCRQHTRSRDAGGFLGRSRPRSPPQARSLPIRGSAPRVRRESLDGSRTPRGRARTRTIASGEAGRRWNGRARTRTVASGEAD